MHRIDLVAQAIYLLMERARVALKQPLRLWELLLNLTSYVG